MRLIKLTLTNIRSHAQTRYQLAKVNLLRGHHGAGKTTVAMALEFAFTGRVLRDDGGKRMTDEGGRGTDQLIRSGAKEARVEVEFELEPGGGSYVLARMRNTVGGTLLIETAKGETATGKDAERWIAERIGPVEVLSVLFNERRFLQLAEKEQRALFAAALPARRVAVPPDLYNALKAGNNPESPIEITSQQQADQFYNWAYDTRKQLHREIKAMGVIEAPAKNDMPFLQEVDEGLRTLNQERDRLIEERQALISNTEAKKTAGAAKHRSDLETERTAILAEARERKMRIEVAQESLAESAKNMLSDEQLEQFIAAYSKGKRKWADLQKQITLKQENMRLIADNLAELEGDGKKPAACPTCKRPYDHAQSAAEIARLNQEFKDLDAALTKELAAVRKMSDPEEAERRLDAHKVAMAASVRAEKTIAELSNLPPNLCLPRIEQELKELDEAPRTLFPAADTSEIDAKMANLEDRIRNGQQLRLQVAMLEGEQKQYQTSVRQRGELERRADALDLVVKYLAEGGPIRTALVGDKFDVFQQQLITGLKEFGFYCAVSLNPYVFTVDGLPLNSLCESEAFRFSMAFQVALARATGIGLAVVDRSDQLLPELRPQMYRVLAGGLEQVIVLAASNLPEIGNPPADTRVFDLGKRTFGEAILSTITAVHSAEHEEQVYEFAQDR